MEDDRSFDPHFESRLRTIIREELHAVLGELETARVRRSSALEELARNEACPITADQMLKPTMFEEIAALYPDPLDRHFGSAPSHTHTIYEEVPGAPAGTFRVRYA